MLYHLFQYLESFDFPGARGVSIHHFSLGLCYYFVLDHCHRGGEKSDPDAAETADRGGNP